MIINIRGTSGSGKTTLARQVMGLFESRIVFRKEGRRQPLGYVYRRKGGQGKSLAVVGHYETACGGCDTIPSLDDVYQLVRDANGQGYDVLFEGLLISSEVQRLIALKEFGIKTLVVGLQVPLDVCLSSVNERRWAKDPSKPAVNPKNTTSKYRAVELSMKRLKEAGVNAVWQDRQGAFELIRSELGL